MTAEGVVQRRVPRATSVLILLAVAGAVLWIAPFFFTWTNLLNLLRQVAITGIIASGMTVVIISGGFDLSVGATAALTGVLAVIFARAGVVPGTVLPIAAGALVGAMNGILVSRAGSIR